MPSTHRYHRIVLILIIAFCALLLSGTQSNQAAPCCPAAPSLGAAASISNPAVQAASASLLQQGELQQEDLQQDEESLPPVLLRSEPDNSASWDGDPITLTFDQPLDSTAADYVTISPALGGSAQVDGSRLTFTPSAMPEPGTRYTLRVAGDAAGAQGIAIGSPIELSLVGQVPLQITSNQPDDGAQEIDPTTQVLVVFNRPVVELVGAADAEDLPSPLTIEPAVEGEGRWISTSVYSFQPARGFAGATTYHATVSEVTAVDGSPLSEPYTFTFTTAAPIVLDATPAGAQIRPDAVVRVQFSQPMDTESTAAAFRVVAEDGAPVDGDLDWQDGFRTLVYTPTDALDFGMNYTIQVDAAAQPASRQGSLRSAFSRMFSVVPLPAVANVSPVDGAQEVSPDTSVVIRFNAPVSSTTVLENIRVTPLLTTTQVFSYYSGYLNELQLSWFKEPGTRYTVTLDSAIADEYGNTLGEDYQLTFTTGDYLPYVRLEAERFTHFTAYSDTRLSVLYRNVDEVNIDLYRLPESELYRLTSRDQWQVWEDYSIPNPDANRIWSRTYEAVPDRNVSIRQVVTLTNSAGEQLDPGVYFVEVAQPGTQTDANERNPNPTNSGQALLVLSNNNLTFKKSDTAASLAWLTDLRTGEPVDGQPIRFLRDGEIAAEGTTDSDGLVQVEIPSDPEQGWWPTLAIAGEPGDDEFALVSSEWSNGIAIWDFGLNGGWSPEELQSHFYTDRPIYRPGQTIYWKGIVRALVDDSYKLPPEDLTVRITLRDPQGNEVIREDHQLNANGTVNGKIQLSDEALTGGYYLQAQMPAGEISAEGAEAGRVTYAGADFMVSAYRAPEFEISVTPDQEEYIQGETVTVRVRANYFSGGALAGAPVTWRIISNPYTYRWEEGPEDRFYSFTPFDPEQATDDPYSGNFYLGLIHEGEGRTGPDGDFVIELPADLANAPQSQQWEIDVTVQSPTNQFVSGRTSIPVHKSAYYLGISPEEYVGVVGEPSTLDFVAVTPEGDTVPDTEMDVVIHEFRWNTVYERSADGNYRWVNSIERTPVHTTTLTTDDAGSAQLRWTPEQGGQYQIIAASTDEFGNATSSSAMLWISTQDPDEFVAWPRRNNDRIELVADKTHYAPGDTAEILVPSPFSGPVRALLTIERGGVVASEVMTLTSNSQPIELPITEDHIPNIYVSIFLVKGVDETNDTPAMRIGYTNITVDTSAKELDMDVESSGTTVAPSSTVAYTVTVTDDEGAPVPNAEMSVALVDRAVLALAPEGARRLLDVFYYERPLGIQTSALLTINRDRMSRQLSEGAKGGGGGGDGFGGEIREEFPDIAFWRAELTTDDTGVATFEVDLPDNLTSWRLVAKAVTPGTEVGDATYDVVATKELQLRPILPRFFTAGDQATIGAALLNTTADDLSDGLAAIDISGAALLGDEVASRDFDLDALDQTELAWPIAVDNDATQVVITMTAVTTRTGSGMSSEGESGRLTDAVRLTLPVMRYTSPETVATAGTVPPEGRTEAIRLPENATDEGELEVTIEPSLAGGMTAGLDYLEHYPYECTEQTVSRFLPNLFTARTLDELEIENAAITAGLEEQTTTAIQRLVNGQNQDGGWGYWPGESSSPFITGYVLWGLWTADEQGYTVPARTVDLAVDYIERSFLAPSQMRSGWMFNETAFLHYVLSAMDQGDPGRASTLYDAREQLGLYGKAFLAMALANMAEDGTEDARVSTLMDDLYGAVNTTGTSAWWQENSVDYRTLNTDTRTTSIVLAAFVKLDPQNPILPQVVRWLMQTRQDGRWSNTQETAWSLIALTDWLTVTGELEGDYTWDVTLNESELGSGDVTPATVTDSTTLRTDVSDLLRNQSNALQFNRDGADGSMYYTTYLRYYLDATDIPARDSGIVVDRSFALADAESGDPIQEAQVGDVLSVTVTIVAPTDLYQLLIETPIPAGTEPLDPNLETTSSDFGQPQMTAATDAESGRSWWRYWVPSYTDMRDDKVALFASFLSAGTYQYTFNVRATIPGEYNVLPVYGEQMYFTEVWGRSSGSAFTILPDDQGDLNNQ